jgi:hypothetical protein
VVERDVRDASAAGARGSTYPGAYLRNFACSAASLFACKLLPRPGWNRGSHTVEEVDSNGDETTATVCDYYSANGHRWTFLDPVRSAYAEQGWIGLSIFGGIAIWITWAVWSDRREKAEQRKQARLFG